MNLSPGFLTVHAQSGPDPHQGTAGEIACGEYAERVELYFVSRRPIPIGRLLAPSGKYPSRFPADRMAQPHVCRAFYPFLWLYLAQRLCAGEAYGDRYALLLAAFPSLSPPRCRGVPSPECRSCREMLRPQSSRWRRGEMSPENLMDPQADLAVKQMIA